MDRKHAARVCRTIGVSMGLLVAAASPAWGGPGGSGAQTAGTALRTVDYHGYHVRVPASWPVIDLATSPRTCVRFDVHAVYLGRPGAAESCPAHLVGRTDALLLEPTATRRADAPVTSTVDRVTGEVHVTVPEAGVLVTASFGTDSTLIEQILGSGSPGADAGPVAAAPATASATLDAPAVPVQPGTYAGTGFETCAAPDLAQMTAWQNSPYQAAGVYIGGDSRACAQPNLTPAWVSAVTTAGWHLIPTYAGSQAPCDGFTHRVSTDPGAADGQGAAEADDAVTQARALGIPPGSVLFDDMESYDNADTTCRTAVLSYLSGWSRELHARGYRSGVYSGAASGMTDLARQYHTGAYTLPDQIWFAWWNRRADTNAGKYVPAPDWSNHQRIHQYHGGVDQTWGGATLNIDGDRLDVSG